MPLIEANNIGIFADDGKEGADSTIQFNNIKIQHNYIGQNAIDYNCLEQWYCDRYISGIGDTVGWSPIQGMGSILSAGNTIQLANIRFKDFVGTRSNGAINDGLGSTYINKCSFEDCRTTQNGGALCINDNKNLISYINDITVKTDVKITNCVFKGEETIPIIVLNETNDPRKIPTEYRGVTKNRRFLLSL